jgi:hypothetical protein
MCLYICKQNRMSDTQKIVCNFGNIFYAGPKNQIEMVNRGFASVFKWHHLKRSKAGALQCLTVYICLCRLQHVCSAINSDVPVRWKWHDYSWRSWIRASWYNYENNQQNALYRLVYYSMMALHVLSDVLAHHQEHLTVFIVSGSVHPASSNLGEHYQIL